MKVKFVPQNVEFEIKPGQSVLHLAQDNGIYIKSVCKGVPSCAECRVRVTEGDHNVLPPASEELSLIGTGHFIDHRRLSCQLKCFGDITVDMTEQIAKEQGILVGRKKKLAVKDDRVEQAVARRSEEPGENESESEEGGESGEIRPPREARGPQPSRPPRDNRPPRDQRDNRPARGPQGSQGPQAYGPRPPQRPGQPNAQGPSQNPNPNGPKKRRRRRGKGGGSGGGGSGPGGGGAGGPAGGGSGL